MRRLLARIPGLGGDGTARAVGRDAGVLFGGYAVQLLTQVGWLILAVRSLGPDGYGLFASLTALTIAASSFVGWGSDQILIRAVARDASALRPWVGHCLGVITATGGAMLVLGMVALPALEVGRIGAGPLFLVLLADLVLARYANLCVAVFMATGQAGRQSAVAMIVGGCRLVAIALAATLAATLSVGLTMQAWAGWYAGASAAAALLCLGMAVRDHGMPRLRWMGAHLGEGLTFAAEGALQASARDLDKPIVLEVAGAEAAGLYAAAFRIVDTLGMPVRALTAASYARMFRLAHEDPAACIAYARRLVPLAVALAAAGGVGLAVFAGLLPLVFGERYEALPLIVRLTCVCPVLAGIYGIWADALSATGRQHVRLGLVCVTLVLTVALCWVGVNAGGLVGAAVARVAVMVVTAGLAWAAIRRTR